MKNNTRSIMIICIYILTYIAALTYMQSTLLVGESWRRIYLMTMYVIAALCFFYIFLRKQIRVSSLGMMLFIMICYEMIISVRMGLFIFPRIIADVAAWPLLVVTFFSFTRENELPKVLKPITAVGFVLVCLEVLRILLNRSYYNFGSAVFATYFCFAFLPLVYYFCSNKVSVISSVVVAILMLFTLKRAAFISVVLGISLYYIEIVHIEQQSVKKIRRQIGLFILLVAIGFIGQYFINRLGLNILNRISSISDDGGSGRIKIWDLVYQEFRNSTFSQRLFGHGFQAVYYRIRPFGISRFAHNSFLEMLYDYGYVGLAFIVVFVIRLIALFIKMSKRMSEDAPIIGYTLVPTLILGFVSYFFEQAVIILPFCVIWGICFGKEWKSERAKWSLAITLE